MKMRFRTDGFHYADLKARGKTFEEYYNNLEDPQKSEWKVQWDLIPPAEPGDVWRVHWGGIGNEGKLAGYAICCILCRHVHTWTSASNCRDDWQEHHWTDKDGKDQVYHDCRHQREHTSCWTWTGSAEENTLNGSPSLQVIPHPDWDNCNFHGHLINGDLHEG